jgi:hypothetical protein
MPPLPLRTSARIARRLFLCRRSWSMLSGVRRGGIRPERVPRQHHPSSPSQCRALTAIFCASARSPTTATRPGRRPHQRYATPPPGALGGSNEAAVPFVLGDGSTLVPGDDGTVCGPRKSCSQRRTTTSTASPRPQVGGCSCRSPLGPSPNRHQVPGLASITPRAATSRASSTPSGRPTSNNSADRRRFGRRRQGSATPRSSRGGRRSPVLRDTSPA